MRHNLKYNIQFIYRGVPTNLTHSDVIVSMNPLRAYGFIIVSSLFF